MPVIFIRDHTFEENEAEVYIKVPLKNINKKDLDLFVTDSYLKIKHQVYMFECFLKQPSISDKTVVQIAQDLIVFKLTKQTPTIWGCLEDKIDKEEKIKLREEALSQYRRCHEEKEKTKSEMKNDLKKFGVKEQIKIDSVNRDWIEQEKKKELNKVDEEIREWKNHSNYDADNEDDTKWVEEDNTKRSQQPEENNINKLSQQPEKDNVKRVQQQEEDSTERVQQQQNNAKTDSNSKIENTTETYDSEGVKNDNVSRDTNEVKVRTSNKEIFRACDLADQNETTMKNPDKNANNPKEIIKKKNKTLETEAIRSKGSVKVNFTARHFPTPTRESLAHEENEWLRKQAEAKRIMEIEDKNLSEEEKNPVWLRNRGNDFFQSGNFLAAINAYTHAIRYGSKLPSLFLNRAACHLKMGNCFKCLEDCAKAQELLTPAVEANRSSRVLMHVRKGTALITLKLFAEGLVEYEAAVKLDPLNEKLKTDAEKIRVHIQTSPVEG